MSLLLLFGGQGIAVPKPLYTRTTTGGTPTITTTGGQPILGTKG